MTEERRPLRRDAQRNRERIRKAASELFAERGVQATLDHVAARAGLGVGTVYRRYPNKDALLDELYEAQMAEIARRAEESLANPDAWETLVSLLEYVQEGFAANRALEHLILHTDRGAQHIVDARERLRASVAALVDRAKADGRLRADFEFGDILMIHAMLAAVIRESSATRADLWRRYFVMIVDGLAGKRAAPTRTGVAAPRPPSADDFVGAQTQSERQPGGSSGARVPARGARPG
jgi:AcrR family transcriptional regulator